MTPEMDALYRKTEWDLLEIQAIHKNLKNAHHYPNDQQYLDGQRVRLNILKRSVELANQEFTNAGIEPPTLEGID